MTSVTSDRRQGLNSSAAIKVSVRVATTANIALTALQTIDGVVLVSGDRVLVKNQTNTADNGIYTADTGNWSRALDFDGAYDVLEGTIVTVVQGALYSATLWRVQTTTPAIGSALVFVQSSLSPADSNSVQFLQAGAGAVARMMQSKERDHLHVADFGGSAGAAAATNAAALTAAITQAAALGKGGVNLGIGGTWAATAATNFASRDVAISGNGKPILDYSAGAGVGFKLDAGGAGASIRGMHVDNLIVKGGAAITDAFYSRGMVASQVSNIEAREAANTGFALKFAVLNTYKDLRVSNDSLAMADSPAIYFSLDTDGTAGNRCQANVFLNTDASGKGATSTSTGFSLVDATGNLFIGGTAESVANGITIAAASRVNTFIAMDLEDNVNYDIVDAGTSNTYIGINSLGGGAASAIQITGAGANFHGGALALVTLSAACRDASFSGTAFPSAAPMNVTAGATVKRYGCYTVDGAGAHNGMLRDILGPSGTAAWVGSQGGAVAQTVTLNEYKEFGALTYVQGKIAFTAAGAAANAVLIAIPAALATKASAVGMVVGTFKYDDAGTIYTGTLVVNSQVEFALYVNNSTGLFGVNPAITIANGDTLMFTATYLSE